MGRLALMWVLQSVLLCGFVHAAETATPSAPPQAPPPPPSPVPFPLEWVRLIPTGTLADYEEKERAIDVKSRDPFFTHAEEEKLRNSIGPFTAEIVLREVPDEGAKPLGTIRAKIVQRKVSVEFQAADAATPTPFTPDLFTDGTIRPGHAEHPWCHQTVMGRMGDWVQLPPRPWSKAGWVNIKASGLIVCPLGSGGYMGSSVWAAFELDGKSLGVLGRTGQGLCVCPLGNSARFSWDVEEFSSSEFHQGRRMIPVSEIPWKSLVDSDSRLKLKLATKPAAMKDVKEVPHPQIGWIGLFNPKWGQYLNSDPSCRAETYAENRCLEVKDSLARQKCVEEAKAKPDFEFKYEVAVRESPFPASPRIGTIIMRLTDNVYADFRKEGSDELEEFKPDELDPDYGYGVHFHHTYLDKKGSWYKLPVNPLPKPGWIDMATVTDAPDNLGVPYGICDGMGKIVVILGLAPDGSGVSVRDDRPWDWCGGDVPEDQVTLDEVRVIPWKDLLDKDGHLLLHYLNKRGC